MRGLLRLFVSIAGLLGVCAGARADDVQTFYRGKTVRFVVGTESVGTYDSVARVLAAYLPKYMPGSPTFLVENMPGASSAKATEYIEKIAPPDGTVVGFVQPYVLLNKLLHPDLGYDPRKLTWVSRIAAQQQIGFAWHTSPVRTMDDAKKTQISLGAGGATGPAAMVPWSLDRMIGAKFKVIMGYASEASQSMAMEQGELQGMGSASWSTVLGRPDWLAKKWVSPLYSISLDRLTQTPQTPSIVELTSNDRDRAVAKILATPPTIGVTMIAPPGVPQARIDAFRKAVQSVSSDPTFRSTLKTLDLDVDLLSGDDVARLVTQTMQLSPDVAQALKEDTSPIR
jgi:tripartite-type tricarboxylate transporter receptor subunit TctC